MKRPAKPTDLGIALEVARIARGWRQADLARALGCHQSWVSQAEIGRRGASAEAIGRLTAALGIPPPLFQETVALVRALRALPESAEGFSAAARAPGALAEAGSVLTREISALLTERVRAAGAASCQPPSTPDETRAEAARRLERLCVCSEIERRALVEELAEYQSWALAEALCHASVEAAADSAEESLALAALAVRVGERVAGGDAWRSRVQGYGWGFLGNARRVKGRLNEADEAFAASARLWQAGAAAEPALIELLDGARLLDLEASLRREQRRVPEALALLERAFAASRSERGAARVLIKQAKTCEEIGDYHGALAVHRQIAPLLAADPEPGLLFAHRFNLLVNLCHLERFGEAEPMLAGVRDMAEELGGRLHLVRLRWLAGRVAAGRGRTAEAIAALLGVRDDFAGEEMPYDAALVTLELATVLAAQGRTAEVKALARLSAPAFADQGVHREAQAALEIFRQAAEAESVSVELAQRVLAFLHRARHEPGMRFEAGG